MATFQQAGDFTVIPRQGGVVKVGGNVSSYFCTPDGRVLHAVGGNVSAKRLMVEARWAIELYRNLINDRQSGDNGKKNKVIEAHRLAISKIQSNTLGATGINKWDQVKVHQVMVKHAYQPMSDVEDHLFSALAGQQFEEDRTAVVLAARKMKNAERSNRPILLVLHKRSPHEEAMMRRHRGHSSQTSYQQNHPNYLSDSALGDLKRNRTLRKFEVVHIPQKQLSALTNLKELSGFEKLKGLQSFGNRRNECSFVALSPQGEVLSGLDFSTTRVAIDALNSAYSQWEQMKLNAESEP